MTFFKMKKNNDTEDKSKPSGLLKKYKQNK